MAEADVLAVLSPGAIFHDRYEVVRVLKSGGMGAIYEVIHLETRRRRALKTMLPSLITDGDLRERFKREATVAAEIESEHIVETFDAGLDAATGIPFLVMELLKGEDLAATIERRKRLPGADVVALLYQCALALDKTHAAGIVHRDLKPENLFVVRGDDGSPRLKVLDFGIAKFVARGPVAKTTRLVGSPLYMSIEQIKGEGTIGPRSDLYAVAQIAYTMLVGEAYWERESRASEAIYPLLLKIMLGAKEPASARAKEHVALPEAFDAWFAKATNPEPEERFGTASALVNALADALGVARPRATLSEESEVVDSAPAARGAVDRAAVVTASDVARDGAGATAPEVPSARPKGAAGASPKLAARADAPRTKKKATASEDRGAAKAPETSTITDSIVPVAPPSGARRLPFVVGASFVALGVVVALVVRGQSKPPAATRSVPVATRAAASEVASGSPSAAPSASGPIVSPEQNAWVHVDPAASPVALGLRDEGAPAEALGFRAARKIVAPSEAFDIHQHEVTWEALDPWIARDASRVFDRPAWLPGGAAERAHLPATGVPWSTARAYCKDQGGSLPTEEQWEYAARGAERRPHAWGDKRFDLLAVRAYAPAAKALPVAPVMSMEQDRTPGDAALFDMTGNAMEWTLDLYRADAPGADESWTTKGGVTVRAVRGLPLDGAAPEALPAESAAWRTPLCATGPCPPSTQKTLQYVGFRCVRSAERRTTVEPPPPPVAAAREKDAPSADPAPAAPAHDGHAKAGEKVAKQTGGVIPMEPAAARPSPGALSSALGAVMGGAKACVSGADFDTFAKVKFGSSGAVIGVSVTGWANAHGKTGCVQSAFQRAHVAPFSDSSYTTRVTVRP